MARVIRYNSKGMVIYDSIDEAAKENKMTKTALKRIIDRAKKYSGWLFKYEKKEVVTTIADPVVKEVSEVQKCEPGVIEEVNDDLLLSEMQRRLKRIL